MNAYIALLRGINVGGNNSLPMKELVAILEHLACREVKTYIQSGNAVFISQENDASRLEREIAAEIERRRGFAVPVQLWDADAFERAIAANPFPEAEAEPKSLHFGFLASAPERPDLEGLEKLRNAGERFELIGSVFYLHAPEGIGRSKLAAGAEKLLGVPMTARNWRTVLAIREMAAGAAAT